MNNPRTNIITQIRVKQLGTHAWQNNLIEKIKLEHEKINDLSGEQLTTNMLSHIESLSTSFNDSLTKLTESTSSDVNILGFPIKCNKTSLQLKMAEEFLSAHYGTEGSDSLLPDLIAHKLYNGLSNEMNANELPLMGSSNVINFWGNENSSVSSVLLANVANYFKIEIPQFGGCTFFPFYEESYKLDLEDTNPFISQNGLLLFGEYQFGGHRYFSKPQIFGPEDCSSSVGKSIGLTLEQIKSFTTDTCKNNVATFGLELVTSTLDVFHPSLIEAGDILGFPSHMVIVSEKFNDNNNISTFEFSRNIDPTVTDKKLGGGTYNYDIESLLTKATPNKPLYVLRKKAVENHCEFSDQELIQKIDYTFQQKFSDDEITDLSGDCFDFIFN